jgi:hypothetical protein
MAQLPKLSKQNLSLASPSVSGGGITSMSQVKRVGVQQMAEYAETQGNLEAKLAKMLDPITTDIAQNRAIEYAAENPITIEQLEAAREGDVSDLKGSNLTVRGKILNKIRATEISSRLQIDAEREMLKMLPDIANGKISSKAIVDKINAITDGFSGSVANLDPEVALKFRASVATLGNSMYKSALSNEIKRQNAIDNIKAGMALENAKTHINLILSNPDFLISSVKKDGSIEATFNLLMDSTQKKLLEQVGFLNYAAIETTNNEFIQFVNQAKKDAIVNFVVDKYKNLGSDEVLLKMQTNDIGDFSALYNQLGNKGKADVRSQFLTRVSNMYTQVENRIKEENRANTNLLIDKIVDYELAEGNPEEQFNIAMEMISIKNSRNDFIISPSQAQKYFTNPPASLIAVDGIRRDVANGSIPNISKLQERADDAGLNIKQFGDLAKQLNSKEEQDIAELESLILSIAPKMYIAAIAGGKKERLLQAQRQLRDMIKQGQTNSILDKRQFDKLTFLQNVYGALYENGALKPLDIPGAIPETVNGVSGIRNLAATLRSEELVSTDPRTIDAER